MFIFVPSVPNQDEVDYFICLTSIWHLMVTLGHSFVVQILTCSYLWKPLLSLEPLMKLPLGTETSSPSCWFQITKCYHFLIATLNEMPKKFDLCDIIPKIHLDTCDYVVLLHTDDEKLPFRKNTIDLEKKSRILLALYFSELHFPLPAIPCQFQPLSGASQHVATFLGQMTNLDSASIQDYEPWDYVSAHLQTLHEFLPLQTSLSEMILQRGGGDEDKDIDVCEFDHENPPLPLHVRTQTFLFLSFLVFYFSLFFFIDNNEHI